MIERLLEVSSSPAFVFVTVNYRSSFLIKVLAEMELLHGRDVFSFLAIQFSYEECLRILLTFKYDYSCIKIHGFHNCKTETKSHIFYFTSHLIKSKISNWKNGMNF